MSYDRVQKSSRNDYREFYNSYCALLDQLKDDQSLFEAEPPETCEELVVAGGELVKSLDKFTELGELYWMKRVREREIDIIEIEHAVKEYTSLLMPPKICLGLNYWCRCLTKLRRTGVEYEKRLFSTHAAVIYAIFFAELVVLEREIEKANDDSLRYQEFTDSMNAFADKLSIMTTKGNDQGREKARQELLSMLDEVNRFIDRHFHNDIQNSEFQRLATRRIQQTIELLTAKQQLTRGIFAGGGPSTPSSGFPCRILMKAQANIQEILNSAADIGIKKAIDFATDRRSIDVNTGQRLDADLNMITGETLKNFDQLGSRTLALQLDDLLRRYKDDTKKRHEDVRVKLLECLKRWNYVRSKCRMRDVAVYEEDFDSNRALSTPTTPGLQRGPNLNPQSAKSVVSGVKGAAGVITNGVSGVAKDVVHGVKGVTTGTVGVITSGVSGIAKGVSNVFDGIQEKFESLVEEDKPKQKQGETTAVTKGNSSMFDDDTLSNSASSAFRSVFTGGGF